MDLDKLRSEVLRLNDANDIPTIQEYLEFFIQCFYDLVKNHHEDKVFSTDKADAKLVLQMMSMKLLHLNKLLKEEPFLNSKGATLLPPIIDPTIVSTLVRNFYEAVCMFNIVYDVPDTEDKKKIFILSMGVSRIKI